MKKPLSLHAYLLLATGGLMIPVGALMAWEFQHRVRDDLELARQPAEGLARSVAARYGGTLDDASMLLQKLASRAEIASLDPSRCDPLLANLAQLFPIYANLATFAGDGRIVCSAVPPPSDVRVLAATTAVWAGNPLQARGLHITEPITGPVLRRPVVLLTQSLLHGGLAQGWVAIAVSTGYLQQLLEDLSPPKKAAIAIFSPRGALIAQWPAQSGAGAPLASLDGSNDAEPETGSDGVSRLFSTARIEGRRWTIRAGVPDARVWGDTRGHAWASGVAYAAMLVLIFVLIGFLWRAVAGVTRAMRKAAEAMTGPYVAAQFPVEGPRELREALAGFNRALVQRDRMLERLRALARRLVDIREDEQRRVSAELHDRVGQNLAALGLYLDRLSLAADQKQEFRDILTATIATVRDLVAELRPSSLDHFGLLASLREHAVEFERRSGLPVRVTGDADTPRLPARTELTLYRIAQEALTNAAKHSGARTLRINLARTGSAVVLEIIDDGAGFDVGANSAGHWGLHIMRERAESIGARFKIESGRGQGTCVCVEVPAP